MPVAETYKGLTIRLGGDSSGLQQALKAISSSVATTESQLRKLKQALKLDPGNADALTKSLDLMGNKAIETQRRVQTLKKQIDQIGSEKVQLLGGKQSAETVRQLADATDDASERAAEARRNYNKITEELAEFYAPIDKAVNATKNLDVQAGTALAEVKRLGDEYRALTGKDFKASSFISDSKDADQAIQQLRELGLITDEQVSKLTNLRESFRNAFNENQVAQAVSKLDQMGTSLIKAEAEAKNVTKRFSEMSRAAMMSKYGEGVEDQLKHIENAANSVEAELKQLDDALALDPNNVELTAAKIRDLQEASNIAQSRVETLNEKLRRLQSDGAEELANDMLDVRMEVERTSQAYDEATAEVKQMEAELRDAEVKLKNLKSSGEGLDDGFEEAKQDVDRLTSSLEELRAAQKLTETAFKNANMAQEFVETKNAVNKAEAELNGYNQKLKQMGKFTGVTAGSLTSLGMSLSTSVTPTLVAAGWGIVQSAQDIDAAYRDMRKTVNGTEEDFESLRQAAIDFSTTNVTSADQILSIQSIGGELGVATEDLKEFAETVSNMDVATDLNAEDAATALGQLGNIMHMTGEEFGPFSDALVRLGNNGASTESQIIDIAKRIGSMASIVGMSTPDVLAWSSSIASTGQNAEAAGTAISNTMSAIETAVAGGGDKLKAFADVARMSAEDFASAWNENPTVALRSFIEGLVAIEEAGGSADATLVDLKITAVRQKQAIMGLMQTIGGLDENLEMSRDAWAGVSDEWGEAGDAAREAERKAEGFSGAVSRLKNIAQATGAELGESLVPIIDGVADVLGELFDQFSKMDDGTKQAIVGIGAFVAALGPMILLGKGIGEFFGGIASGLLKVNTFYQATSMVKSFSGALELAKTAASGLAGVLKGGLVTVGIGAAIGGIALLVKAFQDEQRETELTERATTGLSEACNVVREGMTNAADSTESYTEQIFDARSATDDMRQDLAELADSFDEINRSASIELDGLRRAEVAIHDLEGRSDLTAHEVGELKGAIQQLNDQCGTNYEVVRDSSGAYNVMEDGVRKAKDEIYKLIDAQREQVIAEAQNKKLEALYEEQYGALEKYNEISADYTKALQEQEAARQKYIDKYGVDPTEGINKGIGIGSAEASEWASASQAASQLNTELSQHQEMLDGLDSDIDKVNASLGNLEAVANGAYEGIDKLVMSKLNSTFEGDTDVMLDFADALEQAGFSTEYLSSLSDTELVDLANAWIQTGGDIEQAMKLAGLAVSENFEGIRDKLRSMSDTDLTSFLSSVGMTVDEFATAMERAGISSEQFGQISSDAFQFMLQNCGGDLDQLMFMIQNYDATPIADKNGNISVDTVQLRDAQGQIYTWNGTQLINQNGQVTVQGIPELYYANGEVAQWNDSGQLIDKSGNVVVTETELYDAQQQVYKWNESGQLIDKNGAVHVDQLELHDAYNNVVKLNDTKLEVNGKVNCDYSEAVEAKRFLDSFPRSITSNVYVNRFNTTTNRTINAGTVPQTGSDRSIAANQAAATARAAMAQPMTLAAAPVNPLPSLSEEVAKTARAVSSAPKAASYAASSLVGEAFGTYPGNRHSLNSAYGSLGEIVNNYYDVRLDGINTTPRIQRIMVELLDEMHTMGVM